MITSLATQSIEPFAVCYPSELARLKESFDWLVITHDDTNLLEALTDALGDKSTAILKMKQSSWDFNDDNLQTALARALQQTQTTHIMLLGCADMADYVLDEPPTDGSSALDTYHRLRRGATNDHATCRSEQDRFANRVHQFLDSEAIRGAWSAGRLAVCGLFYRSVDGVFVVYDPDTRDYKPLLAAN